MITDMAITSRSVGIVQLCERIEMTSSLICPTEHTRPLLSPAKLAGNIRGVTSFALAVNDKRLPIASEASETNWDSSA